MKVYMIGHIKVFVAHTMTTYVDARTNTIICEQYRLFAV
jgi:hypothetical protein